MTPEEAYSLKLVSYVKLSERGLLHVETEIVKDKYKNYFFLNRQKIGDGALPQLHGDLLYYVQGEKAKALFEQREFGKPAKLLSLGKVVKYALHRKGILIVGEEKADEKAPFYAVNVKHKFDGRGLLRSRTSLFLFTEGKVRKVVGGSDFDVTDVATNGERVVVAVNKGDVGLDDVYEVDLENGELKKLTEGEGKVTAVAMNEKGEVAFLGHRKGVSPWAVQEVFFPEQGKSVLCGKYCGSSVIADLFDSPSANLVFEKDVVVTLGQEGGSVNVYMVSDGKAEKLTELKGVVRGFDYRHGKLAYFYTTPEKPSILHYDGVDYDLNPGIRGIPPVEVVSGVEGWAIITGQENPTILFVHGGPHGAYGNAYYVEFQFFAKNGYNVIYCNPTGSQGYGEEFARGVVGDWGGKDFKEIMDFVKEVKEKFGLKGKFGVTGGSYGGFMTNWIVTKTDFFSAAISERSISNLVSMCGTSDIGFWFNAVEAGVKDPWSVEGMEKLMRMSPIYYVKQVKTPVMLIHGEQDYRCPIEQAEQFFTALKLNGVATALVRYQGDGHEHARKGNPRNMRDRLKVKEEWFDKYLK
ncbi:MAG: S9 family peptidase [Candidatus Aramenus sulfurataquae]|jgi:dipeptidyl aminopeptidase/acylaminoacyl peptidase|uniref:Acylaminoacyl peptidase n=2 Tax=Candidatus Aramenus sulfurataquae TaxID=1326980 RepID=A0A0F2LPJ9_9CREN|nr:S9 family peptidase [Candidatus Aramenus sulfurataquae]